ncbi:nucleolin-like [Palaemon carinicauda]|uniref:nucleolin-like n=1 Tax=Palaemon carinicauda TaxID=392227 RepID=UPI0035B68BD9
MKAVQLIALTLCSVLGFAYPMQQVELDHVEPLQVLSTFDGYQFGNNFAPDGVYSFFYLLPTSSRKEQRTASGEVKGEYAFVAPEGDEFEFRYNADDEGFRVESNALPIPPEDTDEVKKAKEEFFAAYQKALELADSEESDEDSSEEDSNDSDSSEESDEEDSEESDEDSEGSEEESSEDEEEEEDEKEEASPVVYRPAGFGSKIQRPYPYPYSR